MNGWEKLGAKMRHIVHFLYVTLSLFRGMKFFASVALVLFLGSQAPAANVVKKIRLGGLTGSVFNGPASVMITLDNEIEVTFRIGFYGAGIYALASRSELDRVRNQMDRLEAGVPGQAFPSDEFYQKPDVAEEGKLSLGFSESLAESIRERVSQIERYLSATGEELSYAFVDGEKVDIPKVIKNFRVKIEPVFPDETDLFNEIKREGHVDHVGVYRNALRGKLDALDNAEKLDHLPIIIDDVAGRGDAMTPDEWNHNFTAGAWGHEIIHYLTHLSFNDGYLWEDYPADGIMEEAYFHQEVMRAGFEPRIYMFEVASFLIKNDLFETVIGNVPKNKRQAMREQLMKYYYFDSMDPRVPSDLTLLFDEPMPLTEDGLTPEEKAVFDKKLKRFNERPASTKRRLVKGCLGVL